MYKKFIIISYCLSLLLGVSFYTLAADTAGEKGFGENLNTIADESGYERINNPEESISMYVGILLGWTGFLGVNIIIQIFLAAYEYMTAQGKEDKVIIARKRIKNVIISAIILVGGYLIVSIIINWASFFTGYGQ